jgi:hypothetical protein
VNIVIYSNPRKDGLRLGYQRLDGECDALWPSGGLSEFEVDGLWKAKRGI